MGNTPVSVDLLEVPPSWALYLGPDDGLQINIYTTSSTSGLELSLRTLTPDGAIHYETETLDGASTSTLTTKIFRLSEGFLLGLCISNLGGGLADQVCFVSAGLQFGTQTGVIQHTLLTQGYVTNVMSVAWPPTQPRGPAPPAVTPTYKLIQAQTLATATASVTFSSIPQTYTDLELIFTARGDVNAGDTDVYMQFNADTGAHYDRQYLVGSSSSPTTGGTTGTANAGCATITGATAPTSQAASNRITIYNYAGTTFLKNASTIFSKRIDSSHPEVGMFSLDWQSTAAITSLLLAPASGNFVTGSTFSLYGIL